MPTVYILVGPIASGKSTFAKAMAKRGAVIFNDDAIVEALHAGDYRLYQKRLKPLYKQMESVAIHTALALGCDVVIDRPNTARITRTRYTSVARACGAKVVIVEFPSEAPEVHVRRRFESDSRGLSLEKWVETAVWHKTEYEDPRHDAFANAYYRWPECEGIFGSIPLPLPDSHPS